MWDSANHPWCCLVSRVPVSSTLLLLFSLKSILEWKLSNALINLGVYVAAAGSNDLLSSALTYKSDIRSFIISLMFNWRSVLKWIRYYDTKEMFRTWNRVCAVPNRWLSHSPTQPFALGAISSPRSVKLPLKQLTLPFFLSFQLSHMFLLLCTQ